MSWGHAIFKCPNTLLHTRNRLVTMIAGELLLLPVLQACSEELQVVLDCKDGAGAAALVITGMRFLRHK